MANKQTWQQRKELQTLRRQVRDAQLSTLPSGEKPTNQNADKKSHTEKRKPAKKKISRPHDGKDWETVLYVAGSVLITIVLGAVALPFSAHPSRSLWAAVVALLMLNLIVANALRQRVWRESHSRRLIKRVSIIIGAAFLLLGVGGQVWIWRRPKAVIQIPTSEAQRERRLTSEQRLRLAYALAKGPKGHLDVDVLSQRPEATAFAVELHGVLKTTDWPVAPISWAITVPPRYGLEIVVSGYDQPPEHALVLRDALTKAGYPPQFTFITEKPAPKRVVLEVWENP